MEIRLRLDDKVDADIITEIKNIANSGPASKALYRILLEWYFLRESNFAPKNQGFVADQGQSAADQGQNTDCLDDALLAIDKDW